MSINQNFFKQVETFQKAGIAILSNSYAFINWSNKKFKDFTKLEANLGSSVTFELAPRSTTSDSLVADFKGAQQRYATLTIANAISSAFQFSTEQQVYYDATEYAVKFGEAGTAEIGSKIEEYIGRVALDHTYRFYGDGINPINSYGQLGEMIQRFSNYGCVQNNFESILPDIEITSIIASGLNQFVVRRNEDIAESWELGSFSRTNFAKSNLLPTHIAGASGRSASVAGRTLIVTSTDDPTGDNITKLYCTCDASVADTIEVVRVNDLLSFKDNTPSSGDMPRYLTWVGKHVSQNRIQCRVTEDADSTGTNVTVSIYPALCATAGSINQNINMNILPGAQVTMVPSHRAGYMMSGKPIYVAMPQLGPLPPFTVANKMDPDSGIGLRLRTGSDFNNASTGWVYDALYGATAIDEQIMRVVFPLT